jgi:D-sedoheptulose 7-phosphate isomerase
MISPAPSKLDRHRPDPGLSLATFLDTEGQQHRQAFESLLQGLEQPFGELLSLCEAAIRQRGKLLLFGNGGSAADAQHIAAELVVRYRADRPAIAALALTTDSSTLTAGTNDLGFDAVYSRQVEALGRPGDLAIGISTSGRSRNVLLALQEARARGLRTAGLIGAGGGEMRGLCDAAIVVPSTVTARIQEMHIFVGHALCKALEQRLGLVQHER